MLKVEVDRHSKEPDKIIGCGTTQDILMELSVVIAAISREIAQPFSSAADIERITYSLMSCVTAGVRFGLHAAVKDHAGKEAQQNG